MFRSDEGSVAEWVMLVVLAVGLVLAISAVASPALRDLVTESLAKLKP
jgi:hypothetical protein